MPPRGIARLFEAAARANPPQREEGQRRRMWMMAFAREYGLAPPPSRAPR